LKEEKYRRLLERTERTKYQRDPVGYAHDVLKVQWWSKQQEIANALIQHKRVFVKASHSVGKSFLAAGLVNWWFDTFKPGICITTAPTAQQVRDVLWKEIRVQRRNRPGLLPKNPRLEDAPDHFAVGITAETGDAFQGRHAENVLIVFDEATGIGGQFWDAAEGMLTGQNSMWLVILNPTDTATRAYEECQNTDRWHVIDISALEHPNIEAELNGLPPLYPGAVSLADVQRWLIDWCTPIVADDRRAEDIQFPPQSNVWYRPGPLAEGRMLGRWPTTGSTSVWTESKWNASLIRQDLDLTQPLVIGCDTARFGDDFTSIVVRRASCVLHHETHNGWDNNQIAGRLKQLAQHYEPQTPHKVQCLIDDVHGGVIDAANGYTFVCINSANTAIDEEGYPNKRSELWFATADRADKSRLDLSRLSADSLKLLRRQAMAPTWKVDSQGRRVVEPKSDTKKRIGRSPDDMDALNLAYAPVREWKPAVGGERTPLTAPMPTQAPDGNSRRGQGANRFDPYNGRRR
jgi:hypothetical protein